MGEKATVKEMVEDSGFAPGALSTTSRRPSPIRREGEKLLQRLS